MSLPCACQGGCRGLSCSQSKINRLPVEKDNLLSDSWVCTLRSFAISNNRESLTLIFVFCVHPKNYQPLRTATDAGAVSGLARRQMMACAECTTCERRVTRPYIVLADHSNNPYYNTRYPSGTFASASFRYWKSSPERKNGLLNLPNKRERD